MGRQLTITLDDDVAARLEEAARRAGTDVEEVVSNLVRQLPATAPVASHPYVFPPGPRLKLKPGINLDKIEDLLDEIEGPWRK